VPILDSIRSRLSYANVMATLAVFIALGGSSYAAIRITGSQIQNNSVTGEDIKNDSLSGADVKGLTSNDIQDGSVLAKDLNLGQLTSSLQARGPAGPQGPTGLQGGPGEPGAPGTPASVGHTIVRANTSSSTAIAGVGFAKARDLGTFTKSLGSSAAKLTFNPSVSASGAAFSCFWELRIDGKNNQGGTGTLGDGADVVSIGTTTNAIMMVSVFEGLGAGDHTVSLWVAGNNVPSNCNEDPPSMNQTLLVEEVS
jgi:hypothetical protein